MSKKIDFTKGLKVNAENLKSFENKVQNKNNTKKLISLSMENAMMMTFADLSFKFLRENELPLNNSVFLKILLMNFKDYLSKKYNIISPSEYELKNFYYKKGNINKLSPILYPRQNVKSTTFTIDDYYDLYIDLMHTYFENEVTLKNYESGETEKRNYSVHFFFYDLLRFAEKNKLKVYPI